ncbi:OTU protein [Rhizina undulata]
MDDLLARHRKELRDLTSRITQKKKSATKKTRRGINSECENLEQSLLARHAQEILELTNPTSSSTISISPPSPSPKPESEPEAPIELPPPQDDPQQPPELETRSKKPNRAKARLARRAEALATLSAQAAAEASTAPDRRAIELATMSRRLVTLGLLEQPIPPDGHCLYSAFADQLRFYSLPLGPEGSGNDIGDGKDEGYKRMRKVCAEYIQRNADEFAPFLEDTIEDHVKKVAGTAEWGGHTELLALARAFGVVVNVVQAEGREVERIGDEAEGNAEAADRERKELWLGFYRYSFGLGEHYNSLRKKEL